ncbi:hypothetical protein D9758_013542 [Tetrapyrgos nigripes]|uniref:F-box domain-containing protein n=1 Tax=Tetrapyrgos nigripes TaxID=182062 RepID=A0A8H5FKS3_9AGAR|nr:hypothetical protein D9758_013542 [Tetrapyrgos nigripes]
MNSLDGFAGYLFDERIHGPIHLPPYIIASLQSMLKDEEAHINASQLGVAQEASSQIEGRQWKVAKIRDLLSPIRRLPQECIEEIFFHYIRLREHKDRLGRQRLLRESQTEGLYDRVPPIVLLSNICSHWRNIVHSNPRLWTLLFPRTYSVTDKVPPAALMVEWLEHSRSLLVDVGICYSNRVSDDEWHAYCDLLVPISGRLRSLELPIELIIKGETVSERIRGLSFPQLEETRVTPSTRLCINSLLVTPHYFGNAFKTATRLSQLNFQGLLEVRQGSMQSYLDFPFPTSRLTKLTLICLSLGQSMLRDVIGASP